jgi:hypothetical protein
VPDGAPRLPVCCRTLYEACLKQTARATALPDRGIYVTPDLRARICAPSCHAVRSAQDRSAVPLVDVGHLFTYLPHIGTDTCRPTRTFLADVARCNMEAMHTAAKPVRLDSKVTHRNRCSTATAHTVRISLELDRIPFSRRCCVGVAPALSAILRLLLRPHYLTPWPLLTDSASLGLLHIFAAVSGR